MLRHMICERFRKQFIDNCIAFDTPRLESETYPEDVKVEADILYDGKHALDYYIPTAAENDMLSSGQKAYLLIHGGAFVYGSKLLDKRFGMFLAQQSGKLVVNIDYTLMPEGGLKQQMEDIFAAIRFIVQDKNVKTIYTIGDSAGGYLALLTGILVNSKKAKKDFGLPGSVPVTVSNVHMICGAFEDSPKKFAGYYFDRKKELPHFIYNLTEAISAYGCPPLVLTTGDKDSMLGENRKLQFQLEKMEIPHTYKEFQSKDDRVMHHVFAIAHPDWPEGMESIRMSI